MSTKGAAFLRARRPEHKRQRYDAILAAARDLAAAGTVNAVSLADIAERVGMHKSALLRYFETREEIFLRIAEQEYREWADALVADLGALGTDADPDGVADAIARSLGDRPLLCQLLLIGPLTLERNVSLDAVRTFKRAMMSAAGDVATALHRAVPALDMAACVELLAMTAMIASGLWQAANPPPAVVALQAETGCEPVADLPALPEFPASIGRFVRIHMAGLRSAVPPSG